MSVAVATPIAAEDEHIPASALRVAVAGQVITGNSSSVTTTSSVHVEMFPHTSVAVTITVVVPIGKKLPGAMLYEMVTSPLQLSVAIAEKVTLAPHCPGALPTVILAGQLIIGATVSSTVITWLAEALFPAISVAVHVLVTVYSLGQEAAAI